MTKQDLVEFLAKSGLSKAEAGRILNGLLDTITASLKRGEDVTVTGFGTFTVTKRKARAGRNPQTGATIQIPARKAVRFKVGSELKNAVK